MGEDSITLEELDRELLGCDTSDVIYSEDDEEIDIDGDEE